MENLESEWELIITLPDHVAKHVVRLSALRSRNIPATAWEILKNIIEGALEVTRLPGLGVSLGEVLYEEIRNVPLSDDLVATETNTIQFESNPIWLRHLREAAALLIINQPEEQKRSPEDVVARLFIHHEENLLQILQRSNNR